MLCEKHSAQKDTISLAISTPTSGLHTVSLDFISLEPNVRALNYLNVRVPVEEGGKETAGGQYPTDTEG